MIEYYKPSGKFSPVFILYFVLVSVLIFPILGLGYAYLLWYIPIIYINFFVTLGYAFLVGLTLNVLVIKKGKVRNPILASVIGVLGGVVALYFHWASWLDLVINAGETYGDSHIGITVSNVKLFQIYELAIQPNFVLDLINEVNITGTWGIRGATVSGLFLWVIWIIEALGIVVIASFLTYGQSIKPFCEFSDNWYEEIVHPAFNFVFEKDKLVQDIKNIDKNCFESFVKEEDFKNQSHSIFTVYRSKTGKNYISIENKTAKTNSKGAIEFRNDEFIKLMAIDSQLSKLLQNK
jgi:hypothetical protein